MSSYEKLRQELRGKEVRLAEETLPLPSELELQALWFAGAFGRDFLTQDKQAVRIVQFGEWNRSSGPDFLHASIEIEGTLHSGPLELDTHQADWEHHKHATNPHFREVILHVVFEAGPRTHFSRSDTGRAIPCVEIPLALIEPALRHTRATPALSHAGRCSFPLTDLPAERVTDLLEKAAHFRLSQKALHLHRLEDSHGFEEALWQSLSRALGYGPNKLAMHLLSQRVQRRQLRDQRTHLARESLLFGVAGFLSPDLHEKAPQDSQLYLETLWKGWWKLRPTHEPDASRALPWQLHGVRPTNHPQRRLGALAAFSQQWKKIATPARTPSVRNLETLRERLVGLTHPFWSQHYTLRSKETAKPLSLIGRARTNEFLANYALPRWFHSDAEAAWIQFQKLPPGATSDPVRRAATRLFGPRVDQDQFLKKLWHHQALIQIYHDFCLEDASDCDDCPFPEQLGQW
jgi:hypothetical protein